MHMRCNVRKREQFRRAFTDSTIIEHGFGGRTVTERAEERN